MGVHGCAWVCMGVHGCAWVHVCMFVATYVCMGVHVCACVCMCVHVYVFRLPLATPLAMLKHRLECLFDGVLPLASHSCRLSAI